jgi:hypothetical protein
MFDTIFGLPTHALVVHAVVILLPLAALGAVAIVLLPALRRRFGLVVAALAIVAVATVPVATHSGQYLYDRKSAFFGPGDDAEAGLMQQHRKLGHELWPWAALLLVGVLLVVVVPWYVARRDGRPDAWTRWATLVGIATALVGSVVSTVLVVRIGHAGSQAVWDSVVHASGSR